MSGQGDLQELLRMFTSRKVPMLQAMGYVKSLQANNLKTIKDIAAVDLAKVEEAVSDKKLAKSFHAACKAHIKPSKRPASDSIQPSLDNTSPSKKKPRLEPHKHDIDYSSLTPDALESGLELPLTLDEDVIRETVLVTNRAPLVLAFAVEVLRVTRPEQPPSGRLSLAQAVVSANSRAKAVSIGIERRVPEPVVSEGQPKVRVLGRDVPVLKRGGYTWSGAPTTSPQEDKPSASEAKKTEKTWAASQAIESRSSKFVAHVATVSSPSQKPALLTALMNSNPHLETASHNAWALRSSYGNSPLVQEASFDDGESGAGKFLLGVLRDSGVSDAFVVLTRWYGGVMLGPDRWRIMRECVLGALAARGRVNGGVLERGGDAVWALDLLDEGNSASSPVGMPIHRPEAARNYLLRSFLSPSEPASTSPTTSKPQTTTMAALRAEKEENLGRLLGALRIVFESWADVLSPEELDRRAWGWYVSVRPAVDEGRAGWGAKGELKLSRILELKRKAPSGG